MRLRNFYRKRRIKLNNPYSHSWWNSRHAFRYSYSILPRVKRLPRDKKRVREGGGKGRNRTKQMESSEVPCVAMGEGIKIFHKDFTKLEFGRNYAEPAGRQGNLYGCNLCNSGGATRTRAMQSAIRPGECRKVNGILSSAYAEKFYASVSAFTSALPPHQRGAARDSAERKLPLE